MGAHGQGKGLSTLVWEITRAKARRVGGDRVMTHLAEHSEARSERDWDAAHRPSVSRCARAPLRRVILPKQLLGGGRRGWTNQLLPTSSRMNCMPVAKVSMSLDAEVLAQARKRVGGRGVSAYVNEAVRRQLRRDALAEVLAQMRETNGAVSDDTMEEVRRLWPDPDDEVARPPA